jgi:hypothetical protein
MAARGLPGAARRNRGGQPVTDLCAAGAVTLAGMLRRRDVSARDVIAARKVLHDTVADVLGVEGPMGR